MLTGCTLVTCTVRVPFNISIPQAAGLILCQSPTSRFGNPYPGHRSQNECERGYRQCGTEPARLRQRADGKWSSRADDAADVVGEALGGPANRSGKDLSRDSAEAAEVAGREKCDEWA